jgi:phosphosulfolactate phosphohydrolase-like enzyme
MKLSFILVVAMLVSKVEGPKSKSQQPKNGQITIGRRDGRAPRSFDYRSAGFHSPGAIR